MGRRKGFTLAKFRSLLYTTAKLAGDVQAVRRGRVGERIGRRIIGKATGRAIGWLFRR